MRCSQQAANITYLRQPPDLAIKLGQPGHAVAHQLQKKVTLGRLKVKMLLPLAEI